MPDDKSYQNLVKLILGLLKYTSAPYRWHTLAHSSLCVSKDFRVNDGTSIISCLYAFETGCQKMQINKPFSEQLLNLQRERKKVFQLTFHKCHCDSYYNACYGFSWLYNNYNFISFKKCFSCCQSNFKWTKHSKQ